MESEPAMNLLWVQYDFYFAYCEAAFAVKYIHDYIITWKHASSTAAGQISPAAPAAAPGARSDRWTQLVLLVYIFLCGVCVGRVEGLWLAPIVALSFVGVVALLPVFAPRSLPPSQVKHLETLNCKTLKPKP